MGNWGFKEEEEMMEAGSEKAHLTVEGEMIYSDETVCVSGCLFLLWSFNMGVYEDWVSAAPAGCQRNCNCWL